MSLQKAIEILRKARDKQKFARHNRVMSDDFFDGFDSALALLVYQPSPSPDTDYKKNLTAWIENKVCNTQEIWEHENPYSIFEAWQKSQTTIRENDETLKGIGKILKENGVYDPIDFEEGEG